MHIRRPSTVRRRFLAVVALATVLAGCGGSDPASEQDSASAPTEAETTPPATEEPTSAPTSSAGPSEPSTGEAEVPADSELPAPGTAPTESDGFPDPVADETVFLDTVGLGDHERYERVVFTFDGTDALPGWHAEYVDEVLASGSGNPVEVAGDAYVNVVLSGATGVDLSGELPTEVYTGPDRMNGADAMSAVQEVVKAGDFEATMDWAIGLDSERPFRVFTLTDPARVVVDIMTQ
jgi:hypothetical protein